MDLMNITNSHTIAWLLMMDIEGNKHRIDILKNFVQLLTTSATPPSEVKNIVILNLI